MRSKAQALLTVVPSFLPYFVGFNAVAVAAASQSLRRSSAAKKKVNKKSSNKIKFPDIHIRFPSSSSVISHWPRFAHYSHLCFLCGHCKCTQNPTANSTDPSFRHSKKSTPQLTNFTIHI